MLKNYTLKKYWMGYRTSYIKTARVSSGNSLSSFSRFGSRVLYHRNGVWLMVFGYQRNTVKKYHKFSPRIPPKRRGEIFISLVRRSVKEIHFRIGGWYDPNSQGEAGKEPRTFLFNPTDRSTSGYRCLKSINKIKGLKSIDRTCLLGKMKA